MAAQHSPRFLQLVRRFSDRAQFVIVTHQKRTMELADVLYGVSMAKDGATAVIAQRLEEVDTGAPLRVGEAEPPAPVESAASPGAIA